MRGDNEWHLYHVRSDPEERYDLREDRPEVYARLLASYREYADKNNLDGLVILDAAGVEHPGTEYQGRSILPLQGRSLLPILNRERGRIYEDDEPVVIEFLGNSALLMGDWKLVRIRSGMRPCCRRRASRYGVPRA